MRALDAQSGPQTGTRMSDSRERVLALHHARQQNDQIERSRGFWAPTSDAIRLVAYLLIQQHHHRYIGGLNGRKLYLDDLGRRHCFPWLAELGFIAIWKGIKKERAQAHNMPFSLRSR